MPRAVSNSSLSRGGTTRPVAPCRGCAAAPCRHGCRAPDPPRTNVRRTLSRTSGIARGLRTVGERGAEQPDEDPHRDDFAGRVKCCMLIASMCTGRAPCTALRSWRRSTSSRRRANPWVPAAAPPRSRNPPNTAWFGSARTASGRCARARRAGEHVFAKTEIGVVVVVEPAHEIEALGDVLRAAAATARRRFRRQLPAQSSAIACQSADRRRTSAGPRRSASAAQLGFPGSRLTVICIQDSRAARHPGGSSPGELAGCIACHAGDRMDDQPDLAAGFVDRGGRRVDQERHVVVDDLDDRFGSTTSRRPRRRGCRP